MSIIVNRPAPNAPYFTPHQDSPAGSAVIPQPDGRPIPKLFQPITIRDVTFHNRIWLSPIGQYSSKDGMFTPWHMAHLGGIITRGPGLSVIESTAVAPTGRITPHDAGLWKDEHIAPLKQICDFAHSQNQKVAIQLTHAGRKASSVAPWLHPGHAASPIDGGWPDAVVAPSAIPYNELYPHPREITVAEIKAVMVAFADAACRALAAGIDAIVIHGAHGYLISGFLSPASNSRTDEYGGSFENRTRFALEVVDAIRSVIPAGMPLFLRISATEWLEEVMPDEPSWRLEDTIRLAPLLAAHGVDLFDISSGGSNAKQKFVYAQHSASQASFSHAVREAVVADNITVAGSGAPLLVSAVGGIWTGAIATEVLESGWADVAFVGRKFQQSPGLVWDMARELGVEIYNAHQIEWGFTGRGRGLKRKGENQFAKKDQPSVNEEQK